MKMCLHEIRMKIVQLLWEFHMRFMQATFACVGFSKQTIKLKHEQYQF